MSDAQLLLRAVAAVVRRDFITAFSYRARTLATLLSVAFSIALFYYLSKLVAVAPFDEPGEYFAYAVVGMIVLQMVNATVGGAPATLRSSVVMGTFERLLVSAAGPVAGLMAMLIFPVVNSLLVGLLMLLFGELLFGLQVHWGTAILALPCAALAALAFTPFSVVLLAATVLIKQAAGGAAWLIAAIALVGGLYFPTSLLPGGIQWASDVQPFTPAVELMRNVLVGTSLEGVSGWEHVVRLVAFAAVLLPPSVLLLRSALRVARRRATILEF